MNKHIAIIGVAARSVIWKVLGVTLATSLAQAVGFAIRGLHMDSGVYFALDKSPIRIIGFLGFCALIGCLCIVGCDRGQTKVSMLLPRLRVSERVIALEWSAVYLCCILFFWAMQITTYLLLAKWFFAHADPMQVNHQSVLFAAYYSRYLHSMLPLRDTYRLVRNALLAVSLALSCSTFSYKQRRGKKGVMVFALVVVTYLLGASGSLDAVELDMLVSILIIPSAWISAWVTLFVGGSDDENAQ